MHSKAIIFSAPSGSGKSTLVHHLIGKFPQLAFSISATTRPPRKNEIDGKDYYFLSDEQFRNHVKNDDFLEWEEVYKGSKYGTLKSELTRIWQNGNTVIFDVDVVGGLQLKKKIEHALAVFIKVPSLDLLEKRLIARNLDDEKTLKKRIKKAKEELTFENQFDTVLVNDDLQETLTKAENLITHFLES